MAGRRSAALAVFAAGTARAQLLPPAPVAFEALVEELADLGDPDGLLGLTDGEAPQGLSSPTLCDSGVKQHSGYLPAGTGSNYFFWLLESRRDPARDPLVVWLTGGPGCSSQLALLSENGPCTVDKDGKTTQLNPHSWTQQANVVWVDQPTGTGFSTGVPTTHDQVGVAEKMFRFLANFFDALPQYKNNGFFIFGESYAGHYVPAIAHHIWEQGKAGDALPVNLTGIGIGNGLTNPEEQYKWYPDMAWDGGKKEGGTLEKGVIPAYEYAAMKVWAPACVAMIQACNGHGPHPVPNVTVPNVTACEEAYQVCFFSQVPIMASGKNPYDMRIPCDKKPLCYDFDRVETFLNTRSVQKQLGVKKKWASCNRLVTAAFSLDLLKTYSDKLPDLLADNIRVLIYAGDVDYICNWLGNKKWTLALEWPHKQEFNDAEDKAYQVGGEQVGRLRSSNGLHFLQVFQAGHLVPMDKPAAAVQMLNDFLTGDLGRSRDAELVI